MQKKLRMLYLLILDILLIQFAYYFAFWLRFDGQIDQMHYGTYREALLIILIIKVSVFIYFKLYRSLWEYASIEELINIVTAVMLANAATISYFVFMQSKHLPRSIYIIVAMLDLIFIGGSRFGYRALRRIKHKDFLIRNPKTSKVLVIGAGDAGAVIIKELKNHNDLNANPVAIIDDNVNKQGQRMNGVPIVGDRSMIEKTVNKHQIDEIIIAIPSANKSRISDIVHECKKTKAKVKILPGVYELIDGKVTVNQIREVEIEDLLGREPVHLDTEGIETYIENKRVLVTGGGGSIGSELCRQIARFNPKELIILDIYENNVYDLQNELNSQYNKYGFEEKLNMSVIIASVRDGQRIDSVIKERKPDVIFHAAAHKHVPLMESNPSEAIKNNILGTYNVAKAADKYNVAKFVLISTDKAVNPTNVMGATKRFCEMIVQSFAKVSDTEYVAVRFGNVLGSNGSVIPLFKRQIAKGGPVTVTHKDIIRYFMTIPEAAQLVLQAGAMAEGGEIFVLDMGQPVKIYDLAHDLIKLSGFEPEKDIKVAVTGLRPGEKLYEELLLDEEGITNTLHDKIFIGKPIDVEHDDVAKKISILRQTIELGESELVVEELRKFIPTFKTNNEINDEFLRREA